MTDRINGIGEVLLKFVVPALLAVIAALAGVCTWFVSEMWESIEATEREFHAHEIATGAILAELKESVRKLNDKIDAETKRRQDQDASLLLKIDMNSKRIRP